MPLSVSIHLRAPSWQERWVKHSRRAAHWARTLIAGPELPDYERSRAALGGEPWRRLDHTERWFVSSAPGLAGPESGAIALDPSGATLLEPSGATADLAPDLSVDLRPPLLSRRSLAIGGLGIAIFTALVLMVGRNPPAPLVLPVASVPVQVAPPLAPTPASQPALSLRPAAPKPPARHGHKHRASRHTRRP